MYTKLCQGVVGVGGGGGQGVGVGVRDGCLDRMILGVMGVQALGVVER